MELSFGYPDIVICYSLTDKFYLTYMYTKITYWLQNHQLFLVANLDNLSFVPKFVNLI